MGDNIDEAYRANKLRKAYLKGKQAGVYYLKNKDVSGARAALERLKRQYIKTKSLEDKKLYDGFKKVTSRFIEAKPSAPRKAALNPFAYTKTVDEVSRKTISPLSDNVYFDESKRIKVLLLSNFDYGGSGWMIKQALESTGLVSVVHVRGRVHQYGYPSDFDIKINNLSHRKFLRSLALSADVIHFKGDYPPSKVLGGIALSFGKPMFITVGGSLFRRSSEGVISKKKGLFDERLYLSNTTGRFALTADLNYDWYKGRWVPAPIAVPKVNLWTPPSKGEPIRIGHSPSNRAKKGTNETFLPSIRILNDKGINIEPVLLEKMSHKDCVEAKKDLHLFWDQSKVGFYGNSALEAMRYGIPTICRISEESARQAGKDFSACPIFSFDDNPVSSAMAIERAVLNIHDESKRIYEWTNKVHSTNAVGKVYLEEYLRKLRFKV